MTQYRKDSLTSDELKVIAAFREGISSSIPELAVAARLKPSQVTQAVKALLDKNYLKDVKNYGMRLARPKMRTSVRVPYRAIDKIQLTHEGQKLKQDMLENTTYDYCR